MNRLGMAAAGLVLAAQEGCLLDADVDCLRSNTVEVVFVAEENKDAIASKHLTTAECVEPDAGAIADLIETFREKGFSAVSCSPYWNLGDTNVGREGGTPIREEDLAEAEAACNEAGL